MKIVEIELPDGEILAVETPDGTSDEQLEIATARYWQHKTNPTLVSTAQAIADKGVARGAADVATGTVKALGGMAGAIPQFIEHAGRMAYETGSQAVMGQEIGAPESIKQAEEAVAGRMSGPENWYTPGGMAERTHPDSSETAKYMMSQAGKGFESVIHTGAQALTIYEQLRRNIVQQIPLLRDLPGQQPLDEQGLSNVERGYEVGITAGAAAHIAKGPVVGAARFGRNLGRMSRGEAAKPDPLARTEVEMDTVLDEAMGRSTPKDTVKPRIKPKSTPEQVGAVAPPKPRIKLRLDEKTEVGVVVPDPAAMLKTVKETDLGKAAERPVDLPPPVDRATHVSALLDTILRNDFRAAMTELSTRSDSGIYQSFASLFNSLERFKPHLVITDSLVDTVNTMKRTNKRLTLEAWEMADGIYIPELNTIAIKATGRGRPIDHVIMHETTHAAVLTMQRTIENGFTYLNGKPIPRQAKEAHAALKSLFEDASREWTKETNRSQPYGPWGLTDVYEFIAEALGDRNFQAWMARVKTPGTTTTYWQMFKDAIQKILSALGLMKPEYPDFLNRVLESSYNLIKESTPESRAPSRDGSMRPDLAGKPASLPRGEKATLDFAKEEGVSDAQAMAMADLDAPLSRRFTETIKIGEEVAEKAGEQFFQNLPTDMGPLFQKWMANPEQLTKILGDKVPVLKALVDRGIYTKRKWQNAAETFSDGTLKTIQELGGKMAGFTAYARRTGAGFRGLWERLDPKHQLEMFKMKMDWDNNKQLKDAGLQWPTREMLQDKGYGKATIEAYLLETKMIDKAYDLINWARNLDGKPKIKQIPGYMPHSYVGGWAVKIVAKDAETGKQWTAAFSKGDGTRKKINSLANETIAELQRKHPDRFEGVELKADIYRTDRPTGSKEIIDAMEQVSQVFEGSTHRIGQLVHSTLGKRISSMEQAFLGHAKRRAGVTGWLGSMGEITVKQIAEARENWMKAVFKYAERTDLKRNVFDQLLPEQWDILRQRLPRTAEWIARWKDVIMEDTPLSTLDKAVLDLFSVATGERFSYRAPLMGLHRIRMYFSIVDLAWSLSYHSGNLIQPEMFGSIALAREFSRIKKGNPGMAMAKAEIDLWNPTPQSTEALAWASRNQISAPKLMQELGFEFTKDLRKINKPGVPLNTKMNLLLRDVLGGRRASELNEMFGRSRAFLAGYYYYLSTGMTKKQALRAASKYTDDVMVNYGSEGQPLWISSNPAGQIASRLVAPYAAFRHSYWGHTYLALKAIKANPEMRYKFLPLIQLQLATGFLAGLRGMAFIAEIEMLVNTVNNLWESWFNEEGPLPSVEKVLMESNTSNVGMFGALSAAMDAPTRAVGDLIGLPMKGADVSTTLASPSVDEFITPRQIQGVADFVTFAGFITKELSGTLTDSERLQALNVLPAYMRDTFALAMHPDVDWSLQTFPEVSRDPRRSSKGLTAMEPGDWGTRFVFGKKTMDEQRQLMVGRSIQKENERINKLKADIVELGADQMERDGIIEARIEDQATDVGYEIDEFLDRVDQALADRRNSRIHRWYNTSEDTPTRQRIREKVEKSLPASDYFGLPFER